MKTNTVLGVDADPTRGTGIDPVGTGRTRLMAYALGLAAVAAVPLQLLWPKPSDGEQFSYSDIAGDRELFWLVLGLFAAISVVYLPLQALATMHLVRGRGSSAATVGGVLLWIGCGMQAAGVATWAATYFVATDPEIGGTAGRAVIEAANADGLHLYGLIFPGVVLVTLGTVVQCVALFRAKVTPAWVPLGLLFVVLHLRDPEHRPDRADLHDPDDDRRARSGRVRGPQHPP